VLDHVDGLRRVYRGRTRLEPRAIQKVHDDSALRSHRGTGQRREYDQILSRSPSANYQDFPHA
jgi:hypothetical protein